MDSRPIGFQSMWSKRQGLIGDNATDVPHKPMLHRQIVDQPEAIQSNWKENKRTFQIKKINDQPELKKILELQVASRRLK